MTGAVVVLLLAPFAGREPVGAPGDWERLEDPVQRRLASLLVGDAVTGGGLALVPLYARVPSEAGHGGGARWAWVGPSATGRLVREAGRAYLRVINPTPEPLFVAAGTIFRRDGHEVYIARDAVVPPDFAALFPALAAADAPEEDYAPLPRGLLPPLAAGALFHPGVSFEAVGPQAWEASRLEPLLRRPRVRVKRDQLARRAREPVRALAGTCVGVVLCVGDEPAAVHVFASHELLRAALPDLLTGLAVQARGAEQGGAALLRLAEGADHRGRALTLLRSLVAAEGDWSESYGEGFEVSLLSARERLAGHAVVDPRGRVVHAGYYALGPWWPADQGLPVVVAPPPPLPPDTGNDETPPGVINRKPRPTLAEERQRERNPNPGPPGTRPR